METSLCRRFRSAGGGTRTLARDGGRCVQCGSRFELQYDHVIPLALGGASTVDNLQILCAPCNGRKGASLG
jgi:5-methylcytosine-specific restriction endonuclease McrA